MRTPREIAFRLRQEIANALLYAAPPTPDVHAPTPVPFLPAPDVAAASVRDSDYANELVAIADAVCAGRVPVFGCERERFPSRRDPVNGIETPAIYFRRIPYLDAARVGDHKLIWEPNRHQHLVTLAQAWTVTGGRRYPEELFQHLIIWWKENPFQRGINWTSALEVAFRALSWIWIYHLAGSAMPAPFRKRFLLELYRHGIHLEYNLSIYFSPNTHLLGEAVALHALGLLFGNSRWRALGSDITRAQMDTQVRDDGSHFEQSTYYHVYALDFFAFHAILEKPAGDYLSRLERMAEYLAAISAPTGDLSSLGDDDGGRLFHPYGERSRFPRATLATCSVLLGRSFHNCENNDIHQQAAWWLGTSDCPIALEPYSHHSQVFRDAGMVVMASNDIHGLFDAGPFGTGNAGHSHSDTLSLVLRHCGRELLIDPGTYTYVGDARSRDEFRGSGAHNTIRVNGRDQAVAAGPFRWQEKACVTLVDWQTDSSHDYVEATCEFGPFVHKRRVLFRKPTEFIVADDVSGPPGTHTVEQFWHLGPDVDPGFLSSSETLELIQGWRSRVLTRKEPASLLRGRYEGPLPYRIATRISTAGRTAPITVDEAAAQFPK